MARLVAARFPLTNPGALSRSAICGRRWLQSSDGTDGSEQVPLGIQEVFRIEGTSANDGVFSK